MGHDRVLSTTAEEEPLELGGRPRRVTIEDALAQCAPEEYSANVVGRAVLALLEQDHGATLAATFVGMLAARLALIDAEVSRRRRRWDRAGILAAPILCTTRHVHRPDSGLQANSSSARPGPRSGSCRLVSSCAVSAGQKGCDAPRLLPVCVSP